MSNMGFCSMAVAITREMIPNIAKRPLMISACSVSPVLNSGMYPYPPALAGASSSGFNKRASPKGSGQIVAISETAKK